MAGFVNFKIDSRVVQNILEGKTPGNRMIPMLDGYGRDIAAQAKENTMTARNNQASPSINPQRGGAGTRRTRWRSGEAGRYDSGRLANSYTSITRRGAGLPETRVGSTSDLFEFHEFGTQRTGWGRGILPGRMLRDAVDGITGRGHGNISGRRVYKNVASPYNYIK